MSYQLPATSYQPESAPGTGDGSAPFSLPWRLLPRPVLREPTFKVFALPDKGSVTARIPKSLLGGGDPAEWKYAIGLMGQEEFPSSGVRRIRDVEPNAEQWPIGGGDGSINATRIMDLLVSEAGVQESMLTGYTSTSSGTVDDLSDDKFAQVTPVGNE